MLADTLRLLHPVMPFVTEEIWAVLGPATGASDALLITAPWPDAGVRDQAAEEEFENLAEVVRAARNLRTEARVPAGTRVILHIAPAGPAAAAAIEAGRRYLEPLARVHAEVMPTGGSAPAGGGADGPGRRVARGARRRRRALRVPSRSTSCAATGRGWRRSWPIPRS